jgi:hypothetical protein
MDWLKRIFRRKPPLRLRHPLFGDITYSKTDGWINDGFTLWGFDGVELLIRANETGPTRIQEEAFINFRAQQQDLLPRCLAEVDKVRRELEIASSAFVISGVAIPSFQPAPNGHLWTLWFDFSGDDHFMYGIQTDDNWETLTAFADD